MRIREVTDVAVPPTCTENGLTEGKHCLVCNATLVEQETVLAVGHSFGEWTETKAPTVDEEGSEQRICSACNELETRSVDKLVNVFTDVPDNAFYASAVAWAAGQGINTGISATSFGPDEPCTRGQIVTFLWRSAGEPEPTSDVNPFLDVIPGDFYYNAVLWAVEAGITIGLRQLWTQRSLYPRAGGHLPVAVF